MGLLYQRANNRPQDHRQPSDKKTRVDLDYVRNTQAIFPITGERRQPIRQMKQNLLHTVKLVKKPKHKISKESNISTYLKK